MSRMTPVPPVDELALPPEPPKWPKVIGIISIVWGSLSALGGLCGLGSPLLLRVMGSVTEKEMGPMPPAMTPSSLQMVFIGLGMIMAVVLLSAGISTVSRKASGRKLHLIYGVVALVLCGPSVVLGIMRQRELADWMATHPDSKWAQRGAGGAGSTIGLGVGVVLGLGYPLFCLAWF